MKLTITGDGADPSEKYPTIKFTVIAETADYKTTLSFWGNPDEFDSFAGQLPDFPFENTKDVIFESVGLVLSIHLVDSPGRTELKIATDDGSNKVQFRVYIEIGALHELSEKLIRANFLEPVTINWSSNI